MNRGRKQISDGLDLVGASAPFSRLLKTPSDRLSARLVLALTLGFATPAMAQMMLPGATNGNAPNAPPKATGGSTGGPTPAPIRPVVIKPPGEETILDHPLSLDGKNGAMSFARSGNDITLSKLTLTGDKISKPQETCSFDVPIPTPVVAKPVGRPAGALRFEVPLEACPFTIDVLDGAALVSRPQPTCDLKAADCRAAPGGLWGPPASAITPKQAKDLERQRVRIETTMRTNFRALLRKAGKDRAAVKAIAREQAAFSSEREMTCRDYDQETVHGFCSTQITEARALALLAKFGPIDDKGDRSGKHSSRPKPKTPEPQDATAAAPTVPEDLRP